MKYCELQSLPRFPEIASARSTVVPLQRFIQPIEDDLMQVSESARFAMIYGKMMFFLADGDRVTRLMESCEQSSFAWAIAVHFTIREDAVVDAAS